MESSYNKVNEKFLWLSRDWAILRPTGRVLWFDSIEQTKEHSILFVNIYMSYVTEMHFDH